MPAPISLRLATRQWLARPLRPVLCSIAIAVAVALIICIGVAMDSLTASLSTAIGQALGVAEVHVRPSQVGTEARVPQPVLDAVRALPETDFADGRLWAKASIIKGDDNRVFDTVGVDPVMDEKLRPKIYSAGHGLSSDPEKAAHEIVVDSTIADDSVLNLKVGDKLTFVEDDKNPHEMTIVGIVKKPALEFISTPTMYVDYQTLAKDMKAVGEYRVIDMKLKDSSGIKDYDVYAKALGEKLGPTVEVMPGTTSKAKLGDLTDTMKLLLMLLSTLAAFCAALIIGTTLSVGVQERVRQFGQLRCIGASRSQLAIFLLADAAVMLVIGEAGGVLLGLGLSAALIAWFPKFFMAFQVTASSLLIAAFCGAFATLLGAAIPIWQVTRVSPMAAITATARTTATRRIWQAAIIGAVCLGLQAILWIAPGSRDVKFYAYVIVGIPLIFTGWCLMAPALLLVFERAAARVLGALWVVKPSLLRNAWSRTPWRAGAMIAALMIGVTLFTTVRARGQSLLISWTTPARIPDIIAKRPLAGGITPERLAALHHKYPQISDVTLFDYFAVRMTNKVFQLGQMFSEGDTTFVAVDPDAFTRMVELEYVQGDPETARKEMTQGQHIFVTKEFYNVRHLGVGDKLSFRGADGQSVEFTISAVVASTGVDLVQNFFDFRSSFSEKATSSVLGTMSDGRKYFKMGDPTMMLMNVDHKENAELKTISDGLTHDGYFSFSSVELKDSLTGIVLRIINGLSVIGIGALCVASLGVANMVIASIHARRYEFGVLRAIGAGRFQLVRLVLAEVTFIGLVAGVLGAAAGLHYAYMGGNIEFLLIGIPNHFLAVDALARVAAAAGLTLLAIALTTLLAWLASLAPAIRGAVAAQRTLLASGRV